MENFRESALSQMEDDFSKASTNLPEIIAEEDAAVGTLVIIVISAILSITLLFVMAVFIDCRHQKLDKIKQKRPKKILRISVPRFTKPKEPSEDKESFADKMHTEDTIVPSSVAVIV
ncbi:hypothetical protein ILUMI_21661 [Ignelater luminosus]|uniref:Uncharacterized protein n=1 Tax=Ignelater luminosus TaxID=2038154 RepID=A0A8K0CG08_IGNLU|nr:hypothetical protein ILUMI_21661 [Ignelater luminosus]